MDYIGSKVKLNNWIFNILFSDYISFKDKRQLVFLDACAGTMSVSRYASREGFCIVVNDIMEYSRCIASGSFLMNKDLLLETAGHINEMNNLQGKHGFFFEEYSEAANRLYFTNENAKKIDACRVYVKNNVKNSIIKDYLIYCILEAISRVSNTTGIYGAFLKKFKKRALQPLFIRFEDFLPTNNPKIYSEDINSLLTFKRCEFSEDILYIDPPYNERQYGANYHIYETLAKYDNPKVKGVTGLRNWVDESKSLFCVKNDCLKFTLDIFKKTTARIIMLSYSSDGIMSADDLLNSVKIELGIKGKLYKKFYKRYKADNNRHNKGDDLFEYLFVFEKSF